MQELEKTLLKETEQLVNMHYEDDSVKTIILRNLRDIRKHMSGKDTGVPTNYGWIPVEECLPIPSKEVWVTVKRNGNVFVSTDSMTEKGHFWNYEKENILAWREKDLIPDPYRPKKGI